MSRIPTIRACIKRIKAITISEIKSLSTRDLKGLTVIHALMVPISNELVERQAAAMTRYGVKPITDNGAANVD